MGSWNVFSTFTVFASITDLKEKSVHIFKLTSLTINGKDQFFFTGFVSSSAKKKPVLDLDPNSTLIRTEENKYLYITKIYSIKKVPDPHHCLE